MFNTNDIKAIQKERPDLSDSQAGDVLGFLNDMYSIEPYSVGDNQRLFKETADYIYPEAQNGNIQMR